MQLRVVSMMFCAVIHFSASAQTSWNLIWSDEFSGNSLDLNHWSYEFGGGGWGNNELVYYTNQPDNISVSTGTLKITATRENPGPMEYQSARIITKDKFSFLYGKVEARMRMPLGQGLWPAFWMLGQNIDAVDWPSCGEIDVMEHVSNEPVIHGTVHWNHGGHTSIGDSYDVDVTEYHVYGAIWDEESIDFYVDGVIYFSFPLVSGNQSANTFDQPVFLLLNMAIGGNFPGDPDATTIFPAQMEVDYVRVYQNQFASAVNDFMPSDVNVFPNPASDVVNLHLPYFQYGTYKIMEPCGIILQSGVISGGHARLQVAHLPSGVYTIVLENQRNRLGRSLILQR